MDCSIEVMHPTRLEILRELRTADGKSFSTLQRDVAETSDNLTYHLRLLMREGYVISLKKGSYSLSRRGLIFINTNQEKYDALFPTLSCMIVLRGDDKRLLMRKTRQPHIGRLHDITFAIHSTGSVDENISRFLNKYNIKLTNLKYVNTLRIMKKSDGLFVFDKTFLVHTASLESYVEKIGDRVFELLGESTIKSSKDVLSSTKLFPELLNRSGFVEHHLDFSE